MLTGPNTLQEHNKPLCHCVAMDAGGTALFGSGCAEVHVSARGGVSIGVEGPFQQVQCSVDMPAGVHRISNQLEGEVGEVVEVEAGGALCTFTNPRAIGDGMWFGEVLLLLSFRQLGEFHKAAYVSYFELLGDGDNPQQQHLPFACFRRATTQDGGACGVVLIDSLLWMAPMVPDLRVDGLWRLNNDAWL